MPQKPQKSDQSGPTPPRRRAKLDTVARINVEIARIYRQLADGKIAPAAASRRVSVLTALRSGMTEEAPPADNYTPTTFVIVSVPSSHFLTHEQAEAIRNGESIFDPAEMTPIADNVIQLPQKASDDDNDVA